jgi:hypothetical protein
MAYGTTNGLKNRIAEYTTWVNGGTLTPTMITEAYDDAQGQIDAKLAAVLTPPITTPAWAMRFIHKIADDLAACAVLSQYYINKAPDESQELIRYCDKPLKALDEFVKKLEENPALLDPTITPGENLILSSTEGNDRVFTVGQYADDQPIDDGGTMDEW